MITINEEVKDIHATPGYKGIDDTVSNEPFKDSLEVFIQSMRDSLDALSDYSSKSQDDMKLKEVDAYLRQIDLVIQDIRKIMYPSRNKNRKV